MIFDILVKIYLALLLIFIPLNFRFIFYRIMPIRIENKIKINGDVLFISDLHIKDNFLGLGSFLEKNKIKNIVIVGDLFDSPKYYKKLGKNDVERVHKIPKILGLDSNIKIYFLRGTNLHDPVIKEKTENFIPLGKIAEFDINGLKVVATHGDDLSDGILAFIISKIIKKPILERAWKKFAKIDDNTWVIFGHSHVAKIDKKYKVASCGGFKKLPIVKSEPKGILVNDGHVKIVEIKVQD